MVIAISLGIKVCEGGDRETMSTQLMGTHGPSRRSIIGYWETERQ